MDILTKFWNFIVSHKWISIAAVLMLAVIIYFLRPKAPKPIATESVKTGDIVQSLSITGTVNAEKSVDLTFLAGGLITYLGVKKGDYVNQYQTIATLDQRTVENNLKAALIAYNKQRNIFDQYNLDQQANKPQDALNDRMKRLLQNNQYDLDAAINSVELQDIARQNSILISPIAGIVTRADAITAGINASLTTTFTVVDPNSLTFRMEVDEADIAKVKVGQEVDVNLDSYPDQILHLKVDSIDFVTHTTSTGGDAFYVKAVMPTNEGYQYRVGMNGNATITTAKKSGAIVIPLSSLINDNQVYVKVGKTYQKRTLKLGIQNDTDTQVLQGLSEGDVLVLDPSTVPTK